MGQTFIIANGIGAKLPLAGINEKTLTEAKRFFRVGADEIMLVNNRAIPGSAFWFLSSQKDEAMALIVGLSSDLGAPISACAIKDGAGARRAANQANRNAYDLHKAGPNARRVNHPKFGEGTVLDETSSSVTILFDNQKKPLRLTPAAVSSI